MSIIESTADTVGIATNSISCTFDYWHKYQWYFLYAVSNWVSVILLNLFFELWRCAEHSRIMPSMSVFSSSYDLISLSPGPIYGTKDATSDCRTDASDLTEDCKRSWHSLGNMWQGGSRRHQFETSVCSHHMPCISPHALQQTSLFSFILCSTHLVAPEAVWQVWRRHTYLLKFGSLIFRKIIKIVGAKVGKGKKGGRERGEEIKTERGEEEREREGDTRHTNPSLLPAPLRPLMYFTVYLPICASMIHFVLPVSDADCCGNSTDSHLCFRYRRKPHSVFEVLLSILLI